MPIIRSPRNPCSTCHKNVNQNHRALYCNSCGLYVHIKCNCLNVNDYLHFKKEGEDIPFFCISCISDNIPFSNLTKSELLYVNKAINLPINDSAEAFFAQKSPEMESHISNINSFLNKSFHPPEDENYDGDDISPINCNYFEPNEFCNAKFDSSKTFSILHLNIHSIQKHIETLQTLLLTLESKDFEFDIIAISESKLKINIPPTVDISIDNYHQPLSCPSEANKGGVLLYVNKKIQNFKPRPDLCIYEPKLIESSFIEIINKGRSNHIIGVIYRHPTLGVDNFTDNHMRPLVTKLYNDNKKQITIAGDFNVNLLNLSHSHSSEFFNLLTSNHLLPTITLPTKLNTSGNNTLIDNIFTNIFNPDLVSGNISLNVSDGHLPSFLIIPNPNHNHLPKRHNFHKHNVEKFNIKDKDFPIQKFLMSQDILGINWENILQIEKHDPNFSFENFYSSITPIIDKYLPLKKVSNKVHKRKFKPWVSYGIQQCMKRRDKLYTQLRRCKNHFRKQAIQDEYKFVRNRVIELTFFAKKNYYNRYFEANNRNLRKIWQGINSIINIKSKSNDSPSCISDKAGNIITDPIQVCETFNNHYVNVAANILEERKSFEGDGNFKRFLPPSTPNSISVDPVDGEEVCKIISQFKLNKGCGPFSIPSQVLFHMQNELAKPISWIANICLISGIHPDKLKLAKVIPIFKKGSKLSTANYRPISLLSNINKIIEKLVFSRVFSFLEKNKIIYEKQFGFRPKHSTSHALLNIVDTISNSLDNGKMAAGVFVDFQKAFDTVDHNILISKLNHYGIRGKMNDWFMSYLTNRKQCVSILGFESSYKIIEYGVPQGSVLGPLLFLLYINDLNKSIKHSDTFHFADDTHLLNINDSFFSMQAKLNQDLKGLHRWLLANKISLNAAKTELVIFRKPLQKIPPIKLYINGNRITQTNRVKYLGVYLDQFLDGSAHCLELHKKLQRANGMIAKARHFLSNDSKALLSLYHSIFSSHMTYGCQVWGQSDSKFVKKIQVLQNNALRLITFAESFRDHVSPLYKKLKILKFRDYVSLQNLLFIHDYFNDKLPECFNGYFTLLRDAHDHETRNAGTGHLVVPPIQSDRYGKKSFKIQSIILWNSFADKFPAEDLTNISRSKFKKILVKDFIENYSTNQTI